jgi:succinate-semialdehyde dehydrogenase/glutarate-semialdehyde dehydrogenase
MNSNALDPLQQVIDTEGKLLIAGQWVEGAGASIPVIDKFRQHVLFYAHTPDAAQVTRCVNFAHQAFRSNVLTPYERGQILERAVTLLSEKHHLFVKTMQMEAGFTFSDATGEAKRCLETLRLSAEEARRLSGEIIPLQGAPVQKGRMGFTLRIPLGVIVAITPFNSPLNTVMHKIAPAFAAGNAVILKPSSQTPQTASLLAKVLIEAGMPPGFLSILHGSANVVRWLQEDQRVRFFAFTGSTEVGRVIQQSAGLRRTQMELGSIACCILCDDANLDIALPKVVNAGYRKAGQVCTSVQLLLVHNSIKHQVEAKMKDLVGTLSFGDPLRQETFVGPLISEVSAVRVAQWIELAMSKGAKRLVGGERVGCVVPPTLLTDVSDDMEISCKEVFGPVVCILPFDSLSQAIERVNATPYGLAAGIFTNRLADAFEAARQLEVGGVHINETSSSRVDLMPYGGTKESGFGREGPHYAVQEMTEERVVTITT